MKGFRTLGVGLVFAVVPVALQYLAGVDWAALGISPAIASLLAGGVMMAMRFVTTGPVGKP